MFVVLVVLSRYICKGLVDSLVESNLSAPPHGLFLPLPAVELLFIHSYRVIILSFIRNVFDNVKVNANSKKKKKRRKKRERERERFVESWWLSCWSRKNEAVKRRLSNERNINILEVVMGRVRIGERLIFSNLKKKRIKTSNVIRTMGIRVREFLGRVINIARLYTTIATEQIKMITVNKA